MKKGVLFIKSINTPFLAVMLLAACKEIEVPAPPPPEVEVIKDSQYVIDRRVEPPMCFLVSFGQGLTAVPCQRLKGAPPKIIREIVFPEAYPPDAGNKKDTGWRRRAKLPEGKK